MASKSMVKRTLLVLLPMLVLVPFPSAQASPKVKPRAFDVELHPDSEPVYTHSPNSERSVVLASDGVELFVEIWRPAARDDGPLPPDHVPTVLVPSPYASVGSMRQRYVALGREADDEPPFGNGLVDHGVIPYGYAWAVMHLRGTGASGGCMQFNSEQEADDVARVVEHILEQDWSNGRIAGYGDSHEAGVLLNAAGRRDRASGGELFDAIVAVTPSTSWYDSHWTFDGVRIAGVSAASAAVYHAFISGATTGRSGAGEPTTLRSGPDRAECADDSLTAATDPSGDFTGWYAERDVRAWAPQITTPVLITHGHYDLVPAGGNPPSQQVGLFDRLGGPKVGLFGLWGHEAPDWHWQSGLHEEWHRADFSEMRTAWYEHWVQGRESGVTRWPVAQVQDSEGQWRSEPDWPSTGGRVGQLALGPGGSLGAVQPTGESAYREAPLKPRSALRGDLGQAQVTESLREAGTFLEFLTAPLPDRLQVTGQPVLDLVVKLESDDPHRELDSHVAAVLEVLDAEGNPVGQKGRQGQITHTTFGLRSARHLDPMPHGYFVQAQDREPPRDPDASSGTSTWFPLPIRFQPTDLVVPAGGRLRVTIAGSLTPIAGVDQLPPYFAPWPYWDNVRDEHAVEQHADDPVFFSSLPSGHTPLVRVSHDCSNAIGVSALRFLMPDERPHLLDVAESQDEPLHDEPPVSMVSDGGGLATAPICGSS